MDDATKQGYGMMMLEQGLPKSHFYASAIARLKRDVARDVGPPVKPHLPFGVLGSGRDRVPSKDLAAITAKLDRLHPCAALTTDQLLGDEKIAFAMTPADSKQLYGKLVAEYGAAVEDLEPKAFFERLAAGEEQERLAARAAFVNRGGAPPPELAGDAGKAAASARARITLDHAKAYELALKQRLYDCLLYTSPSPRDATLSRMPSSA